MKAVVFHDVGGVRLDKVSDPGIAESTEAVIRITSSASCGADLHRVLTPAPTGRSKVSQAKELRISFARTTMVKLPDEVSHDRATLFPDIFAAAWFDHRESGCLKAELEAG